MPKLTAQEKLEKKRQLEEKREARRLAKEQKEKAAANDPNVDSCEFPLLFLNY